jgi:acetyl-CoA carboxylase carboxyltransferase component/biotin carboxyl carrier protein
METMGTDGVAKPAAGRLSAFDLPAGRGIRVDTFGYSGYRPNPNFDSLLAKVICHSPHDGFAGAMRRVARALRDFRIEGIQTNIGFLQALLRHDDVRRWLVHTRFVDENIESLLDKAQAETRFFESGDSSESAAVQAGAKVDPSDPLAVLAYGKTPDLVRAVPKSRKPLREGVETLDAVMQGTIVSVEVGAGDEVRPDDLVLVMESMKMEHEIRSDVGGVVQEVTVDVGDTVYEGHPLAFIEEKELAPLSTESTEDVDLDHLRPDLAEVHARHAATLDAARPDAVAKRRRTGQRTARENVDDLCDPGSFVEYGQLALTPGTGLPREAVIRKFPTDGMIAGIGSVNGAGFGGESSRCVVLAYDYTVLAGTQGVLNHVKTDRMLELAIKWRRPVVLFAEGGGGRAGTGGKRKGGAATTGAGQGRTDDMYRPLDTPSFATMGSLSGLVPLVGITSRYCFAGNASLLGCCDVIIATADSSIGMGGPALIEGGGLGVFRPEEVGPMEIQVPNGVVDLPVADEAEAVAVAKKYLSYFQGPAQSWECADQRLLRRAVPENRLRVYRMRKVIDTLADTESVLELRPDFGPGMITSLVRIEGRPVGILANNPQYLSGAIDSNGSDKGARFMQLCDCFDIPIVVLCDTPGMMVGPEIERTALVRHSSRLFVAGANLSVPLVTIILRKAYGLGAQAMAGGHTKRPILTVAWPTAEHGGMGLEGQMKLGFRNELAAISDPQARKARYDELVAAAYERGKALNAGVSFAFDDVIDPADTRRCIVRTLESVPRVAPRTGKKRPFVDTW